MAIAAHEDCRFVNRQIGGQNLGPANAHDLADGDGGLGFFVQERDDLIMHPRQRLVADGRRRGAWMTAAGQGCHDDRHINRIGRAARHHLDDVAQIDHEKEGMGLMDVAQAMGESTQFAGFGGGGGRGNHHGMPFHLDKFAVVDEGLQDRPLLVAEGMLQKVAEHLQIYPLLGFHQPGKRTYVAIGRCSISEATSVFMNAEGQQCCLYRGERTMSFDQLFDQQGYIRPHRFTPELPTIGQSGVDAMVIDDLELGFLLDPFGQIG